MDTNEEISALIATLHVTQQRLEELTAGEVDTVADRDGRTFLLRHAQERLRHSETAKQAAILNALPASIAMLDVQGVILSVNEAWRSFANENALQAPGHAIGLNYLEICERAHDADSSEAQQAAAGISSVLGGESKRFSLEYPCHSPAEQRWFLMTVTPMADDHPRGAVVMHLNITERKQVELALYSSERKLCELARQLEGEKTRLIEAQAVAKVGSWETDLSTLQVIWSEETYRIFETDPKKFQPTHQGFLQLVHPDDRAAVDAAFFKSQSQHSPCTIEHRLLLADDRIKFVQERWQVFFDGTGKPVRALGTSHDITESRRALETIANSETRLSALIENSSDVIAITDLDGQVLYVSPSVRKVAGYEPDEVIGQSFLELVHPEDRATATVEFKELLRQPGLVQRVERRYRCKNGTWIDSENIAVNLVHVSGVAGIVTTTRNITERKQAEGTLKKRAADLETFHRLSVGRELRMIELKQEVNGLALQAGQKPPYEVRIPVLPLAEAGSGHD